MAPFLFCLFDFALRYGISRLTVFALHGPYSAEEDNKVA